ncbi:MAG TPA: hypothetical protein PKA58_26235 [Polyangium sp.]|jgi:hypothetical protein|nr:hypothetical protein [Polyangium sp.]
MRFASFDGPWAPLFVSALAVLHSGCEEPKPKPQIRAEAAPEAPPYPELDWAQAAKKIESGDVTWIVPARDRRVFISLKNGDEHVTTASSENAVEEIVKRVDPSGHTIVLAKSFADYKEILWRDIPALLKKSRVYFLQQNGRRRVLIQTMDEDRPSGFYVTIQPRFDDITPLVPTKYDNGMYVKRFNVREVNWETATTELTLKNIKHATFLHGGLVYLRTNDDRELFTVDSSPNGLSDWLSKNRPDFHDITVE